MGTLILFPTERASKTQRFPDNHSASIVILPSIRIERHEEKSLTLMKQQSKAVGISRSRRRSNGRDSLNVFFV